MKSNFILPVLVFISFTLFGQQQKVIPLSDNFSFVTSDQNTTITHEKSKRFITGNGTEINVHRYSLDGENTPITMRNMVKNGDKSYDFYSINGFTPPPKPLHPNDNFDTLFIKILYNEPLVFGPDIYMIRHNNNHGAYVPYWLNDTVGYYTNIEHDTIDLVAQIFNISELYTIFNYDYPFVQTDTVYFSPDQATHPVILDPVDENGQSINSLQGFPSSVMHLAFNISGGNHVIAGWNISENTDYYVSDYHKGLEQLFFASELRCTYMGSFPSYLIEYPELDSITDSVYFTNSPDSIVNLVSHFTYFNERDYNNIGFATMEKIKQSNGSIVIIGAYGYVQDYKFPYWEGSIHLSMQDYDFFGDILHHHINYIKDGENINYIHSPIYEEYSDSAAGFIEVLPNADVHYFENYDTIYPGQGIKYFWNIWQNTYGIIHVIAEKMGMWGEWIYQDDRMDSYIIKDESNNVVASGSGLEIYHYGSTDQTYTVIQKNSFSHFNGFTGESTITSQLNPFKVDHTPPTISKIYFVDGNNKMKFQFADGEQIYLKFSAADFVTYRRDENHTGIGYLPFPDSLTSVFVKKNGSGQWIETEVQKIYCDSTIGSVYSTELSDYLETDSAIYDIKIHMEDYKDNIVEYVFRPAFIYGSFYVGTGKEIKPQNNNLQELAISPNPAHRFIRLSVDETKDLSYEIFSMDGKIMQSGNLNTNTIDVTGLASGIYTIALKKKEEKISVGKFIKK